jgi:hypothetical protein
LELAKEHSRSQLEVWPIGLPMVAVFLGCLAYFSKDAFAWIPALLVAGIAGAVGVSRRRHLRKLEAANCAGRFVHHPPLSMAAASPETKREHALISDELRTLSKPRRVRLKAMPKVIAIAFPVAIGGALYFGFGDVRDGLLAYTSVIGLLIQLFVAFIWSAIAIQVLLRARRDWKLLAEGDVAVATVTAQWMTGGGRHRRSKIGFQFKDSSGRLIPGEADDDSRTLLGEMPIAVFYNPSNPKNCVPLALAACQLVQR